MTNSNPGLLLFERVVVITLTTVEGTLYGLTFTIYILCCRSLCLQLKDAHRRRQNIATLLYMSIIMACGLLGNLVTDSRDVQLSFVDHADYPGGGIGYLEEVYQKSPVAIMGYVMNILLDSLTFGVQIWRLWVIWKVSRYRLVILAVPILSLLVYIGTQILNVLNTGGLISERLSPKTILTLLILADCLIFGIAVTITVLISTRIARVRRQHIKAMDSLGQSHPEIANQYMSIISMLVESFALESLWLLVAIILNLLRITGKTSTEESFKISAFDEFFSITQPYIQILAYLLVTYRVTTGRAWKKDTEQKLSSLQWNRDERSQVTQLGTVTQASLPTRLREEA